MALLASFDADPDPQVRLPAVAALGASRSPQANPWIRRFLSDPDPAVRVSAYEALTELPVVTFDEMLLSGIDDSEPGVRRAALLALGATGDGRALPPLLEYLTHTEAQFRVVAAVTLSAYPSVAVVQALTACHQDPETDVRSAALRSLIQIASLDELNVTDGSADDETMLGSNRPERRHVSLAIATFLHDREDRVACGAAAALAPHPNFDTISLLAACASDPRESVRLAVVQALSEWTRAWANDRDGEAQPPLDEDRQAMLLDTLDLFRHDRSEEIRVVVVDALSRLTLNPAVDCLIALRADRSAEVRAAAVSALEKHSPEKVAPLLRENLRDPAPEVRVEAAASAPPARSAATSTSRSTSAAASRST